MIPSVPILNFSNETIPTNTFRILYEKDRVSGDVDDLLALEQAIYLMLNTERYKHTIYSWQYGVEFSDLIGKNSDYAISEIKKRVTDCLLQDNRILEVENFKFEINKNKILCEFSVTTIYGNIKSEVTVQNGI